MDRNQKKRVLAVLLLSAAVLSGEATTPRSARAENSLSGLAAEVLGNSNGFSGGTLTDLLGGSGNGNIGSVIEGVTGGNGASRSITEILGGNGDISSALGNLGEQILGEDALGGLKDILGSGSGGLGGVLGGLDGLFGGSGGSSSGSGSGASGQIMKIIQGISQITQMASQGNQAIQQIVSPIMQFAEQAQQSLEGIFGKLLSSMGGGGKNGSGAGADPQLSALLKQAMGALNLPDPSVIAENIGKVTDSTTKPTVVSGVNPTTRDEIAKAMLNAESARLIAGGVLSKEAQEKTAEQLKGIMDMSTHVKELAGSTTQLSGNAQQAGAIAATVAQSSTQAAAAVGQTAQSAQSAVSTQDVLKQQANIMALQSGQLSALTDQGAGQAAQLSAQSSQLGNISNQMASDTEIQIFQTTQLQQVSQNVAASNQTLADMSEVQQGERQKQQIDESSASRELNSSWSKVGLR